MKHDDPIQQYKLITWPETVLYAIATAGELLFNFCVYAIKGDLCHGTDTGQFQSLFVCQDYAVFVGWVIDIAILAIAFGTFAIFKPSIISRMLIFVGALILMSISTVAIWRL